MTSSETLLLATTAFVAGAVNGALGYGFSSLTVPIGLLFLTNRTLNPALVCVEIVLNSSVLWMNRGALGSVIRPVVPIVIGLVPGVIVGTMIVGAVDANVLRLVTFVTLLPLILLQAGGYRRYVARQRSAALAFGVAVGVLYAVTTISGPPLALALNNQGLVAAEFRAALGLIRLAESSMTSLAYTQAGFFTSETWRLVLIILPAALAGIPLGASIVRRLRAETFRRVCMSVDAWIVAFGLALVLRTLFGVDSLTALAVVATVGSIDAWLLYRYFSARQVVAHVS